VEPFGNQVVVITLSGAQMAQLLEAKAKRSGDFYEGPRLVDTSKTYTVATSDYLAVSEAGYWVLARGEAEYLGVSVREVLEKYLAEEVLEIMEQGAR
jgi:2',3'-cyclic-nucleotide 2'-phosphodiesterase (5'-nucleotidase family)